MKPAVPTPDDASQGGWSDPGEPTLGVAGGDAGDLPAPGPRYSVGALLGRGGMGAVYAARDGALGRDVALKELQPELADDAGARARLAREAAVTSRLDHPGIVSVHDAGVLPDGRPFYTMRLVRGRTLGRAAAEATTPEARRQLVRHVLAAADAVAAAHDVGVVHRDLKPANILIGAHGETQVVDWGLATPVPEARDRWADLPAGAARGVVGTHAFMAPEQARGEPPDPRHDVWSLGVTLAVVAGGERRELSPELAAIVARATAPAPEDRYPDAAAFAEDLLRWFEGRRVAAYAYSRGELLRRTIATWRVPLAVGAAGLVALAVAVGVGWWQTTRSLARAVAAEADARGALADLRLEQAVAATRAGARETAERLAADVLLHRDDPLARGVFAAFGRAARPARLRAEPGPTCAWSALPAGAAWVLCGGATHVSRWEDGRKVWTAPIAAVAGEVRGDVAFVWDATETSVALDVATGAERGRYPLGFGDWVPVAPPRTVWTPAGVFAGAGTPSGCPAGIQAIAASDAGRVGALCTDGTLLLGPVDAPARVRVATEVTGDHVAVSLAWTPGGDLVVGTLRGRVYLFDGATGAVRGEGATELGVIGTIRVSPDGRLAALGGTQGGIGLWRLDTSALVGEVPAARPRAFAFGPDGLRVHDGQIRTWRLPSGAPALVRGRVGLADVAASPTGRIATAGGSGEVRVVDLVDGATRLAPLGDAVVKALAFDASGTLVATGMGKPWLAVEDDGRWAPVAGARRLRRVAWLDDGALVGSDLHLGLYRWARRDATPVHLAANRMFTDLERDGDALVTLGTDGRVERVDGETFTTLATEPRARGVALRGDRLVIACGDGVLVRDRAGERWLDAPDAGLLDVAISDDGARVAAAGLDGFVRVWDAASGALLGRLPGHTERVVALAFLPDGDLVSGSWDKTARVWALRALDRPVEALAAEVEAAWGPR